MSYSKCVYYHCNRTSRDISMFHFPVKDQDRLKLWIRNSGNCFLGSLTKEQLSRRYICADHFLPTSIHRTLERSRLIGPEVPVHFQYPELPEARLAHDDEFKVLKPLKVYGGRREAEKTMEESGTGKEIKSTTKKNKKQMKDMKNLSEEPKQEHKTNKPDVEEPQAPLSLGQCCFCGEYNKDFVTVTSEKPYLVNNRTSITMNGLTVDLDFNNTLSKTVCRYCDGKLQELHDFVKQVKEAQDTLFNVTEEIETVIIKTESQTLEDTKEGIVDSMTAETNYVDDTVCTHKRTHEITIDVKKQKQKVTKDIPKKRRVEISDKGYENSEIIIDIKEEPVEKDESGAEIENSEVSDTGTDVKPSDIDLTSSDDVLNDMIHQTFS